MGNRLKDNDLVKIIAVPNAQTLLTAIIGIFGHVSTVQHSRPPILIHKELKYYKHSCNFETPLHGNMGMDFCTVTKGYTDIHMKV